MRVAQADPGRFAAVYALLGSLCTLPVVRPTGYLVAGLVVTLPLVAGVALLGARRARWTQAAYDASVFFRRLDPADRQVALALLDDPGPRRGRVAPELPEQAPAAPRG